MNYGLNVNVNVNELVCGLFNRWEGKLVHHLEQYTVYVQADGTAGPSLVVQDFGEHGMAPTEISTSSEYQSSRRDKIQDRAKTIHALSAPIPGDTLLEELIAPAR